MPVDAFALRADFCDGEEAEGGEGEMNLVLAMVAYAITIAVLMAVMPLLRQWGYRGWISVVIAGLVGGGTYLAIKLSGQRLLHRSRPRIRRGRSAQR